MQSNSNKANKASIDIQGAPPYMVSRMATLAMLLMSTDSFLPNEIAVEAYWTCLLYTSPSPRDS